MLLIKRFLIVLWLLIFFTLESPGGTTGKISGTITDASTGEALIGANVFIDGIWIGESIDYLIEKQGAATDVNGEFYILNINPGVYQVKIMMMGYSSKAAKVKINVDKTTFLEVSLDEEVIQGEVIVIIAEKEEIQRDLTSSKATISSDKIGVMAVENVSNIVELQAGVTDGHFRGGRLGEVSYMIDGVMVNNDYESGRASAVAVETEAVQDILVISGTFNAEYGKAMSGIVNTITKEGGTRYEGGLSWYSGNYISNRDGIFTGLDNSAWDRIKDLKYHFNGPLWGNKITFFVNGRFSEDGGYIYGVRRFLPGDESDFESIDTNQWYSVHRGNDEKVSLHNSKNSSFMGKLTVKPFSSVKLNFTAIINDGEFKTTGGYGRGGITDKQYHGDDGYMYKYNPDGMPTYYNLSKMFGVSLNHVINTSLFYDLKLNLISDNNKRYVFENPLDSRYAHPKYSYKRPGFYTGGNNKIHDDDTFKKNIVKFDLNWQLNQVHGLKTGFELALNQVNIKHRDIVNTNDDTDGEFIPAVLDDESFYTEIFEKEPMEFSAYLQDKMEFDEMIVNLGLRLDWFDPKTDYPTDYKNPDNSVLSVTSRSEYKNTEPTYQFSPRLGIAYQLADAASLHFSYGHFLQIPAFYSLYQEHNFHVSSYNYETQMGNGRLKPEKTVSYEIGLQQKLAQGLVADVSVYYRDIYNLLTVKTMETYDARFYGLYDNLDYATVKGLTLNLDYQYQLIFANLNYTLQYAEGEASSPSQFFLAAGTSDPPVKLTRLSYDQRHTINAVLGFSNKQFNASMILTWNSNYPYTYSPKTDDYRSKAKIPINNSTMPDRFNADFSAQYQFDLVNKIKGKIFLEIYNLFDTKNEYSVFSTSGRANSSLDIKEQKENFRSDFSTVEEYFYRPDFYSAPRRIKIGLGFNFNSL